MFFWDPTYLILIPGVILALWAQLKVHGAYKKYSALRASRGFSGQQIAQRLLELKRISGVNVEGVAGNLTDHYDPRCKTLRLSEGVYGGDSIAAVAIAAHETGHALQDAAHYYPMQLRGVMYPVSNFGSMLAFPLFFIGLIFHSGWLLQLGILLFLGAVAFTVVTLPVEFNASRRALAALQEGELISAEEKPMVRAVLNAAAMTYVAATVMALLELLRLLLLANSRRD